MWRCPIDDYSCPYWKGGCTMDEDPLYECDAYYAEWEEAEERYLTEWRDEE